MSQLRIKRIKHLTCPYCKGDVDGSNCKPMTETVCGNCGSSVRVPGVFGNYLLYARIRKEPLCVVYSAFDNTLERSVAVRMVNPNGEKKVMEMMLESAKRIAGLNHVNIAKVHRVDQIEDVKYIEEELLLGGAMKKLIDNPDPISEREALEIMRDVAMGLEATHRVDIPHLDVSPKHIRFDGQGIPKLTNFSNHRLLETDRKLIGSPLYVSPEAAKYATGRDGQPGKLSDMFSLGACFYHLLAKQPPFVGDGELNTIKARFKEKAPRLETLTDVAADTGHLFSEMLEPSVAHRLQDTSEVVERLDAIIEILYADEPAEEAYEVEEEFAQQVPPNQLDMNQQLDQSARDQDDKSPAIDLGERTLSAALASVSIDAAAMQTAQILKPVETAKLESGVLGEEVDPGDLTDWHTDESAASVSLLSADALDDLANVSPASASITMSTDHETNISRLRKERQTQGLGRKSSPNVPAIVGVIFTFSFIAFFVLMRLSNPLANAPQDLGAELVIDPAQKKAPSKQTESQKPDLQSNLPKESRPVSNKSEKTSQPAKTASGFITVSQDTYFKPKETWIHGKKSTLIAGGGSTTWLSFDISQLSKTNRANLEKIELHIDLISGGKAHTIEICAIKDGKNEIIDELKTNPQFQPSKAALDKQFSENRIGKLNASSGLNNKTLVAELNKLIPTIRNDSNDVVTICMYYWGYRRSQYASKEHTSFKPPRLFYKLATSPQTSPPVTPTQKKAVTIAPKETSPALKRHIIPVAHDTYLRRDSSSIKGNQSKLLIKSSNAKNKSSVDRITYLRFNISSLSKKDREKLEEVELLLFLIGVDSEETSKISVGLINDGKDELIDEKTMSIKSSLVNTREKYLISPSKLVNKKAIGEMAISGAQVNSTIIFKSNVLMTELKKDSNDTLTLVLFRQEGGNVDSFASKEHTIQKPPRLVYTLRQ